MRLGRGRISQVAALPLLFGIPVFLIAPLMVQPYTLAQLCIFAILALSLGLIWGFGGILCFGQGAFFGLGAYAYVIIVTNMGLPWGSLVLAILFTMLISAILGMLMFYGRLSDVYLAVVTLVVTLILNRFMNSTAGPEYHIGEARLGGFNGIPGFRMLDIPWSDASFIPDSVYYFLCFILLLAAWIFCRWLLSSHFGRVMVAVRENERRVEFAGYDTRLHKTVTFTIGGGLAGLAGVLYANWAAIVTPALFSLTQSAEIIIWTIVGGLGTLIGPIIGAVLLVSLRLTLGYQTIIDNYFIMGILLILVVLWFPRGIAGGFLSTRFMQGSARRGRWRTRSSRLSSATQTPQGQEKQDAA